MGCIHRSNIRDVPVIEATIKAFAERNGLTTVLPTCPYRCEYPNWELRHPLSTRGVVMVTPNTLCGEVGLFITPCRYDWPTVSANDGNAMSLTTPDRVLMMLPKLLQAACEHLGWDRLII
jgi:hypothetical protein